MNWVWRTDHPVYGLSLVHATTDTVINFSLRPHQIGHARLFTEGSADVEDEVEFGSNTYQDWVGAAAWLAARYGTGDIDQLTTAVRDLRAAWLEAK